ncbi:MAG: cation diffusion facilitator family transporter [Candidatus Cloacimonetes bacterium]|nr:cation diffusion facilitator family transporter [Candidatus Cloacimonadota bacterium]
MMNKEKLSIITVNLGLFYNIILSLIKTFFGIVGHSTSLLADGINSTSDVVYYIAVKILLKIANKPADKEHPFGHKQMESIASIVIAAFIITTAIAIAWNSLNTLIDFIGGNEPHKNIRLITLYIALFTFISKIFLSIYTMNIGKKTNNPAIQALASDHINDIYASSAVIIGIFFAINNIYWVDPLAGIVVSVFILKTGVEILKKSTNEMMDIAPTDEMQNIVNNCANRFDDNITIESILSHRYGNHYSLNITIGIDGELSMNQADNLADRFEKELLSKDDDLKYAFIHYHPRK